MLKGELQSFVVTHFCCREATSYHDPTTTAIVLVRRYVQLCIYQIFLMGVGVSFKQLYLIVHCPTLFDFKHYNKISCVQCLLRIFIPIKNTPRVQMWFETSKHTEKGAKIFIANKPVVSWCIFALYLQ